LDPYRDAMTQPYVYWMLKAPFVTIIGLYSNIDGLLDGPGTAAQERWLSEQLAAAGADASAPCLLAGQGPRGLRAYARRARLCRSAGWFLATRRSFRPRP